MLAINAREVQYLRNQSDASANTPLPIHFPVVERERKKSWITGIAAFER